MRELASGPRWQLPGGRALGLGDRGWSARPLASAPCSSAPPLLGVRLANVNPAWCTCGPAQIAPRLPIDAVAIARLPVNYATLDGEAACLSMTEDRTSAPCARATPARTRACLLGVHFTSAASAWRAYCALEPQLRFAGGIIPFHVRRLSPSLGSSCVDGVAVLCTALALYHVECQFCR